MADGTVVNISGAMTRDELVAQATARYAPITAEIAGYAGKVKYRRLKAVEQDDLYTFSTKNPDLSIFRYNAKIASLGLVEPALTYDEALEMPAAFLVAVAALVTETTNDYRAKEAEKAADGPAPFLPLNFAATDSPSSSEKPSAKSKP